MSPASLLGLFLFSVCWTGPTESLSLEDRSQLQQITEEFVRILRNSLYFLILNANTYTFIFVLHDDEKAKMKKNLDAKEVQLEAFKENYVRNFK